ncbi:MAG: hypothetical protein EOP78_14070 [Variovorax sp.]|nr:MAG: hypothetical protein EOP78_14070 [Variovorax sp.]
MHLPILSQRERVLLAAFVLFLGVALFCPPITGVQAGASLFADDRAWHHLPNAMDVLSNLPFLAVGAWGLRWLHWLDRSQQRVASGAGEPPVNTLDCAWLFFAGLIACAAGSVFYHLQPDVPRLAADRAGMAIAFAGLIGCAVCERVSQRAGWTAAWATLAGGLLAVAVWHETGNVAPWAVVQFGGMGLVLALALARPMHDAVGLKLGWVIFFYALAKLFELGDHAIYEATQHLVSGHSLKHLTAALAGLPVLHALQTLDRQSLRHNPGAAALTA